MLNKLLAMIALLAIVAVVPKTASAGLYVSADLIAEGEAFADDPMFNSQGWFNGVDGNGDGFIAGGGVLIDPHWILTVTHVTLSNDNSTPWASMSFSMTNRIFGEPPELRAIDEWYTFPGYNPRPGRGNDIALMHLVDPIFDVIPAVRYRGNDEAGMHVSTVGYGNPGTWPREGSFDGVQRAGENIVDCVGCFGTVNSNYLLAEFDDGLFTPTLPLEWVGAQIDSGGGWFADVDGSMQLVGLSAFILGNHNTTGATRISLYNDWIDDITSVPEPSSLVLLSLVGSITLLVTRRRTNRGDC